MLIVLVLVIAGILWSPLDWLFAVALVLWFLYCGIKDQCLYKRTSKEMASRMARESHPSNRKNNHE